MTLTQTPNGRVEVNSKYKQYLPWQWTFQIFEKHKQEVSGRRCKRLNDRQTSQMDSSWKCPFGWLVPGYKQCSKWETSGPSGGAGKLGWKCFFYANQAYLHTLKKSRNPFLTKFYNSYSIQVLVKPFPFACRQEKLSTHFLIQTASQLHVFHYFGKTWIGLGKESH